MSRKPTAKRPTVKPTRRAQAKRKQPHLLDRMVAGEAARNGVTVSASSSGMLYPN